MDFPRLDLVPFEWSQSPNINWKWKKVTHMRITVDEWNDSACSLNISVTIGHPIFQDVMEAQNWKAPGQPLDGSLRCGAGRFLLRPRVLAGCWLGPHNYHGSLADYNNKRLRHTKIKWTHIKKSIFELRTSFHPLSYDWYLDFHVLKVMTRLRARKWRNREIFLQTLRKMLGAWRPWDLGVATMPPLDEVSASSC